MKKLLLLLLFTSTFAFAQNAQDISQLYKTATKNFFEEEANGYPASLLVRMTQDERKNFDSLRNEYDANPTKEQKAWEELIARVYEKCPDNADSTPTNTSLLNPNVVLSTPDRVIINLFEKSSKIPQEFYERARARQELASFITNNREEIYAYATLFCPRHGMTIRGEANMDRNFSYKEFYDKLPKAEQEELNRLVYISKRHLNRLKELQLVTTYMLFILQDVPQLMYKDFKRENPLAAEIEERCQDECHVHEIRQPWKNYAREYAKTHMKTPDIKCENKSCPCNQDKGAFYGHKQSFIEVAGDIENLKGKTVVFLEDGSKDEIEITQGIAYSLSNGRIVVFPESSDDQKLLTAALFFSEDTAKELAKECQKDQWFGVLPGHNMLEGGKCYPREEVKKYGK